MAAPTLRIVKGSSEADIDAVNQWMRAQPWYQSLVAQWGGHPGKDDAKKQAIVRAAQQNGVQVDEGNIEIDDTGNFNPKGHKLRNALIGGAIGAGAAFGAPALIGALGGGGAAGAGGAAAAGSAGAGAGAAGGAMAGGLGGSFWGPILSGAIGAGANIFGATKAANANEKAAELAAQGNQEALAFLKQQYADRMAYLKPFMDLSADAVGTVRGLSGVAPSSVPPANPNGGMGLPGNASGMPVTFGPLAGQTGGTIASLAAPSSGMTAMVAPDGTMQQVPSHLVSLYEGKGAKRLGV